MACTSCDQAILLAQQLRLARRSELMVPGALIRLVDAPLGFQPAAFLEATQRGAERSGLNLEQIVRLLADGLPNPMAMLQALQERPEDEHVQSALEQLQVPVVGELGP